MQLLLFCHSPAGQARPRSLTPPGWQDNYACATLLCQMLCVHNIHNTNNAVLRYRGSLVFINTMAEILYVASQAR